MKETMESRQARVLPSTRMRALSLHDWIARVTKRRSRSSMARAPTARLS